MSMEVVAPTKPARPDRKQRSRFTRASESPHPITVQDLQRVDILDPFHPRNLKLANIDWVAVVWIAAMHIGCLAAPFYFSWPALGAFIVLHWLTSSVGICLGYHRYLTHCSLKLAWPAKFFVLLCSSNSGQGSPLTWCATHRVHHGRSDKDGDPHSPLERKWWWSHILWLFVKRTKAQHEAIVNRYVPDLARDPMVRFFERTWAIWMVLTGVVLFAAGGLPMLLWGLCARMTVAYHGTWCVNSATHLWGYRNYETTDDSRNLWWVALCAYGEGWHNNHHAYPRLAPAGHHWWEFDPTWWTIRVLRFCRLATDVNDRIPAPRKTP